MRELISRFMVLDPSLIPHSIDVVIGEYIYELHFKVEHEEMMNQIPIDMDDNVTDDRKEDGAERNNDLKPMRQDHSVQKEGKSNSSAGSSDAGGKNSQLEKKLAYSILALEMLQHAEHGLEYDGDEVAIGVEAPNSEPSSPIMQIVQLKAVPETESPRRRSKRRADTVNEASLEHVERIKAAHNLDFKGKPDAAHHSFLQFSNDVVISNLDAVGITLAHDHTTIDKSISNLRQDWCVN
jgi:hypothetical protein